MSVRGARRRRPQRWGEMDDITPVYTFRASRESRYVTGPLLCVDGGGVFVR